MGTGKVKTGPQRKKKAVSEDWEGHPHKGEAWGQTEGSRNTNNVERKGKEKRVDGGGAYRQTRKCPGKVGVVSSRLPSQLEKIRLRKTERIS